MPYLWLPVALALIPTADAAEVFVVQQANGKPAQGVVREIGSDRSTVLVGTPPVRIAGDELIGLRRLDVPLPGRPTGPRLVFANGDVLPGTPIALTRDRISFTARIGADPNGVRLDFPLTAVGVVWLAPPDDGAEARRLARAATVDQRGQDVVGLRNGERLLGTFTGLEDQSATIEVGGKVVRVERARVTFVALNSELAAPPTPKGPYGHVVLAGGGRLGLSTFAVRDGVLSGKTLDGEGFSSPWKNVVALDVYQGPAVYLSDLKPRTYKYTPFLPGLSFQWRADRALDGGELRLGGGAFDKGLGMHDQSQLTYTLGGEYRRFEALVGVDDPSGCVRVRVLVDGKGGDAGWEKELTADDGPQVVRVELAGARQLTLAVDYAGQRLEGGKAPFVGGRVSWADARLIKGK